MQAERIGTQAGRAKGAKAADKASAFSREPPCPSGCIGCQQHLTRPCCILFEVTQRCNLRCGVCYADAGFGHEADPDLAAIAHWYDELKRQAGICHIQLSGGEPTLRDDLDEIIRLGLDRGFDYFQLNTNGIRLAAEPQLAQRLKAAGLTTVFLQFDGLDDRVYQTLRGARLLDVKEQAIAACAQAALPVVLVPTIVRGVNDDQLADIVGFGVRHNPVVRGVHFQPATLVGRWRLTGRFGKVPGDGDRHVSIPQLLAELQRQSAGLLRVDDFSGGTAEHEYCSFNANYYIAEDGRLRHMSGERQPSCCGAPTEEEEAVAAAEPSCCGTPAAAVAPAAGQPSCCGVPPDPDKAETPGRVAFDSVARAQDIQRRRWGIRLDQQLGARPDPGTLDEAYWQATTRAFSITGMAFMDSQTLDVERLRRCYIFVMDHQANLVPFCAYNLTDGQGQALYRGGRQRSA
jgi:uncharacterized radical SAM superfamily Fe-S cluster-containing enzyme